MADALKRFPGVSLLFILLGSLGGTVMPSPLASAAPVTAVLRLQERESNRLKSLAQNIRNAQSAGIRSHYEPKEIQELAGPHPKDYLSLLGQLKRDGFKITAESPTHLWVSIQADSSIYDRVFESQITFLQDGRHRTIRPARIPAKLSLIASVSGLDTTLHRLPGYRTLNVPSATAGGISATTIKTAYGFDPLYQAGFSGSGQDIAVATYSGFKLEDVNYFYQALNLQPIPSVDQVQVNGTLALEDGPALETQMDAEFAGMIAPGAAIHVFSSADNSDAGELQLFTSILDDNRAKIISYSWGNCELDLSPVHKTEMDAVFARAIAQGVNVLAAAGDYGSETCTPGKNAASWPAAHPDVVAVGGTTFALDAQGAIAETAWTGCGPSGGGGGGMSSLYDLPDWQNQLGSPYVKRSYPDVSFNANAVSGQAVYGTLKGVSGWVTVGGTSMATPQWAGFLALVGQARALQGKEPLGFLPPLLYGMDPSARSTAFHDITSGNNCGYTAGPGWDAVTGWGSMVADLLLAQLAQD